jgi:hypothetical protein
MEKWIQSYAGFIRDLPQSGLQMALKIRQKTKKSQDKIINSENLKTTQYYLKGVRENTIEIAIIQGEIEYRKQVGSTT